MSYNAVVRWAISNGYTFTIEDIDKEKEKERLAKEILNYVNSENSSRGRDRLHFSVVRGGQSAFLSGAANEIEDTSDFSRQFSSWQNTFSQEQKIAEEIAEYQAEVEDIKSSNNTEELKELYKNGNREERELAKVALGEESPNTLRSLKGWETGLRSKQNQAAFQSLFD